MVNAAAAAISEASLLQPSPEHGLKTVNDIKVQPELQPLYDYLAGRVACPPGSPDT